MENFLKEFKSTDFEVDYDNQVINLTYDCGDFNTINKKKLKEFIMFVDTI